MTTKQTQIVFIAGLSGSGKTTAMAALEDLSFYCVDNLPVQLVPQFLSLCTKATSPIHKIALALDAREKNFLDTFPEVVADLRSQGSEIEVIFLDCANETLETRYRETRRVHPLSPEGNVRDGIEDHGYFALLAEKKGDAAVQALIAQVSQPGDLTQHASGSAADLQLMMDLRDAVASQLEG